MSRIIRSLSLLIVFLVLFLTPFIVRYLSHHQLLGGEDRPELPIYDPAEAVEAVPTASANLFVDEPTTNGSGFVLLDAAHGNRIEDKDIQYLDSRLSLRGYQLLRHGNGDLATALRGVSAYVIIAPLDRFDRDEIAAVTDFVNRGGRLLMVGDPTRFNVILSEDPFSFDYTIENDDIALNSLANEFDIIFVGDYLYNTVRNEGNFRNIVIDGAGLGESDLTQELDGLAFYGAHSLTVGNGGRVLLMGDDNTASSATDRPGNLALAVLSANEKVLALGDMDFLAAPYYTSLDNSAFVARIADFLVTTEERRFVLRDFPFFYQENVDLVYVGGPDLGPDAFDEIILLQDAFQNVNIDLTLAAATNNDHDTLYLGLYNQATDLADVLSEAGITLTIDPAITPTEDEEAEATPAAADDNNDTIRQIQSALGNIQMPGTALILLHENGDQKQLFVLAASKEGLENTIDRLLNLMPLDADYSLADCLVQDNLALCPSGVTDEAVEAELETGGVGEPIEINGNEDNGDNGEIDELGAVRQGAISLDETVDGSLNSDESHSWVFNQGPAIIDITLEGSELDGVLELYDSNYELLEHMDSTFSGEAEVLNAIEIADDDSYYILVKDYFGDPSDYTLTIETSSSSPDGGSTEASIFIFEDDDGTPLAGGISSASTLADILGVRYEITVWTTSIDGPLSEEILADYNLIIWDSGDYRTEDAALDEDALLVLNHVFDNAASLIIFGTTPALLDFETGELISLSDLEVVGEEPILMDNIPLGEIYTLDQTYDVLNLPTDDIDPDTDLVLFAAGPDSSTTAFVGAATTQDTNIFFLLAPYISLPLDLQAVLLTNVVTWMGF